MTREQLESEASDLRQQLRQKERALESYLQADKVRDTLTVLTINNTTIAWQGNGGITDPVMVTNVREYIAKQIMERAARDAK